jgi:hypothetical protein
VVVGNGDGGGGGAGTMWAVARGGWGTVTASSSGLAPVVTITPRFEVRV